MTLYNPGDTVLVTDPTIGAPANFGGNAGVGSVQGQSWYPNTTVQWVFVKFHPQGPVFQLPASMVQPVPGTVGYIASLLPGARPWSAPGHHLKTL
jgi:hypothetical protein